MLDSSARSPLAKSRIFVLSVDDNPMMADVIGMLVSTMPGLEHAGHFLSGTGVIEEINRKDIRALVLDYEIPGTDTLDLIRNIKSQCPDCSILMLSAHGRPDIVEACRRAGASGYVLKDGDPTLVMQALQATVEGGEFFVSFQQEVLSTWWQLTAEIFAFCKYPAQLVLQTC